MAIVENWLPPSRENWELLNWAWQFFPLFTAAQWLVDFYPQGKTSTQSRFNIPGKIAWATMEAPGFITLLYIMFTLPQQHGIEKLPTSNWVMAGLFTTHYLYRAIISPLFLNPSMSPIHVSLWAMAFMFQVINGTCIGGWLAAYGPVTMKDWEGRVPWVEAGMMIFAFGLLGNMFHDDELREVRRAAARNQKRRQAAQGDKKTEKSVDKVYIVPQNGLFKIILYPHYLCEWVEWCGFWMIGGLGCVPARSFVFNEITTMTARAVQGKRWYIATLGKEQVGNRKAIIPGVL